MPLPQPLHIFRKDATHLWPETLIVVALFVAFAFAAPSRWATSPYGAGLQILSLLLKLLMPLSWLVLIARLIHDEPLVGDRQFWTSRPYHWATLLAAKILYLVVFLYVPFFVMQAYLLKHAGLYPSLAIPALLHNLLLLTVVIVIPLTAIAAVTGTFARMLLASVGAFLYILILAVGFFFIMFERMIPPSVTPFAVTIFILLPAAALVYQYATRKTTTTRLALAAVPLVIFLLLIVSPSAALIRSAYPVTGSSAPVLGAIPAELASTAPKPGRLFALRTVAIELPVSMTGGDEKNVYVVDGTAVSLGGDQQPYMATAGTLGGPRPYTVIEFPLSKTAFDKVKSTPTDLHLSVTADHLVVKDAQQWHATLLPFSVPGHGICNYPQDDQAQTQAQQPVCHFPLAPPDNTFVSAPLQVSCAVTPGQPPQQAIAGQDFDPVVTIPLNLQIRQQLPPGVTLTLCPGSSLSFIHAESAGKTRFEFDEKQVVLDNYAVRIADRNAPPQPPQ
jgi:hypothetical protein